LFSAFRCAENYSVRQKKGDVSPALLIQQGRGRAILACSPLRAFRCKGEAFSESIKKTINKIERIPHSSCTTKATVLPNFSRFSRLLSGKAGSFPENRQKKHPEQRNGPLFNFCFL
jgi:hypothetical protein